MHQVTGLILDVLRMAACLPVLRLPLPVGGGSAVQVMIDTMDLAPGDYAASLYIVSNDPERPLLAVPLTLTVTESAPVIDVDPENLAATKSRCPRLDEVFGKPSVTSSSPDGDLNLRRRSI